NDVAVKDKIINSLGDTDATMITGHFTSIDQAGAQYGYDNSVPQYKSAILTFDTYVGEILTALKARPAYAEENWLVVIASSEGGEFQIPAIRNDHIIFSHPDANTFTISLTAKYNSRFIGKPYL